MFSVLRGGLVDRDHLVHDHFAVKAGLADGLETDLSVLHRVDGVVLADLHVRAGDDTSAALADDDIAYDSSLSVMELRAKILRL